jgi:hypothetical protein
MTSTKITLQFSHYWQKSYTNAQKYNQPKLGLQFHISFQLQTFNPNQTKSDIIFQHVPRLGLVVYLLTEIQVIVANIHKCLGLMFHFLSVQVTAAI